VFREVFGPDVVILCSVCRDRPITGEGRWCRECMDLHVRLGLGPPPGICAWCWERTVPTGGLCLECDTGETGSIGIPLSDAEVRRLGFVPTARGWVPRTAEVRERLEAADRSRTAEREAGDDLARRLARVAAELRRMVAR
jgi:hypothetical protein